MVWSRACFSQACLAIGGYKRRGGAKAHYDGNMLENLHATSQEQKLLSLHVYVCARMCVCVHHVMFALDMSTCGVSVTGSTERGNARGACRVQICCVCMHV